MGGSQDFKSYGPTWPPLKSCLVFKVAGFSLSYESLRWSPKSWIQLKLLYYPICSWDKDLAFNTIGQVAPCANRDRVAKFKRPRILGDQKISEDNQELRPGCPPDYQIFYERIDPTNFHTNKSFKLSSSYQQKTAV